MTDENSHRTAFDSETDPISASLTEEVEVPDRDWLSAFPRHYQLMGAQIDDECEIGVRLLNKEESSSPLLPDEVYDDITELLTSELDVDELCEQTTATTWIEVGKCTVERSGGGTAKLSVDLYGHWKPLR